MLDATLREIEDDSARLRAVLPEFEAGREISREVLLGVLAMLNRAQFAAIYCLKSERRRISLGNNDPTE